MTIVSDMIKAKKLPPWQAGNIRQQQAIQRRINKMRNPMQGDCCWCGAQKTERALPINMNSVCGKCAFRIHRYGGNIVSRGVEKKGKCEYCGHESKGQYRYVYTLSGRLCQRCFERMAKR